MRGFTLNILILYIIRRKLKLGKIIKKNIKKISIITLLLIIAICHLNIVITMAAESDLTLTPKPETNNIHLKWTGPQNSSYKIYQKKPGTTHFETIGLTDFSNNATDEEVKVLNIYPSSNEIVSIPNVHVVYKDGQVEDIPKSALLKVWMEGRNSYRRK